MKKNIKNKNIDNKLKHSDTSTSKQLSYSIIVPIKDNFDKIKYLIDTILTIEKKNYQRFELILVYNNSSIEELSYLHSNEIFDSFIEQGIVKLISTDTYINKAELIYLGINNANKDTTIVFDIDSLNNSFNINDLLKIEHDINNKVCTPIFQTEVKTEKNKFYKPVLVIPLSIAKVLYSNLVTSDANYQLDLNYKLSLMELEIEEISLSQQNPFIEDDKPPISSRLFRKYYSFINWFFILPIKELKNKPDKELLNNKLKESSIYRFAFVIAAIFFLFAIPMMSYNAGNTFDEDVYQYPQALKIVKYYSTFGTDTSYREVKGLENYGMSFDTFTVVWNKLFNVEKIFETRHAMNGFMGWLAILFCGLLAYRLANWRAGLITLFLIFFSPPFLGQCFNNPKDIPFATAYIFTIYFIVRFIQQFPKPSIKVSFCIALGIAMAISIRISGLLLIPYLFLFVVIYYLIKIKYKEIFSTDNIVRLKKLAIYTIVISVLGYFMGLLLWPYALESPLINPFKTLAFMTNFPAAASMIFEGATIWSHKVPFYYTIKYILITAPISVLIGFVLYSFTIRKNNMGYFWALILFISFGFPILYTIYLHSNLYNGWRHSLYVYPPLVVMAGLGFNKAIDFITNNKFKFIGLISIVLLSFSPIKHTFVNHPYEYVYYNELEGGVKNAYGNYELDYYYHSLKEAAEWIKQNEKNTNIKNSKIKIGAFLTPQLSYYFRNDTSKFEVEQEYIEYFYRGNKDWDYAIFVNDKISTAQLKNGTFPPPNTIHTINVDGKPICAIIKRNDKNDLMGYLALRKKDTINSISYLKKAIDIYPNNETALYNLAYIYNNLQKIDSADLFIKRVIDIDPMCLKALFIQAQIYFVKSDFESALNICNKMLKIDFRFYEPHYMIANIYAQQSNLSASKSSLHKLLDLNPNFKPAYIMLSQIAQVEGDNETAQKYKEKAAQIK